MKTLSSTKSAAIYSESQTTTWLAWLAFQMKKHDQTVFFIENLQPDWIQTKKNQRAYMRWVGWIPYVVFTLLIGVSILRSLSGNLGDFEGIDVFLCILSPIFGFLFWAVWYFFNRLKKHEVFIKPIDTLKFSRRRVFRVMLIFSLVFMIIGFVLILVITSDVLFSLIIGFVAGLFAIVPGLFFGLSAGITAASIEMKTKPNQGIVNSRRIASLVALAVVLIAIIITILENRFPNIKYGSWVIPFAGVLAFFRLGGLAVFRHYILRLTLFRQGSMPLDYTKFLDYASNELNFLQKVGGGYIFVHRYLLEHFAAMEEARQTSPV